MTTNSIESDLADNVRRDGFAFIQAPAMRQLLGSLPDWTAFATSWSALEPDAYLARVGRHRRRRHAVFSMGRDGPIQREPHQPHFQASNYNLLQGGIERWFAPIAQDIGEGPTLRAILAFALDFFSPFAPGTDRWHVEAHQFRIEARAGAAGEPTPEGIHRDGVDYVLVLLIDRANIASGTTTIHAADGTLLGSFTLTQPLDAALVEDTRVFHGVTPVLPLDSSLSAHRDVLVITLKDAERLAP